MSIFRFGRDPQCDPTIPVDCGDEVYAGETIHRHGYKWYCQDCHDRYFDGIPDDDDDGIFEPAEKVVGAW